MGCGSSKDQKPVEDEPVDPSALFFEAVVQGNTDRVRTFLAAGLNPNIILNDQDHGRITPLILAVAKGDTQCTRVLINAGADLDTACGRLNTTALQQAAGAGHEQCVKILLDQGAKANYADMDGDGPLHVAAMNGHVECVLALLKHGVNVNATNGKGWTPLHYACLNGHLPIIHALREAGADVYARDRNGLRPAALALPHVALTDPFEDPQAYLPSMDGPPSVGPAEIPSGGHSTRARHQCVQPARYEVPPAKRPSNNGGKRQRTDAAPVVKND